jgi:hypothetical protein
LTTIDDESPEETSIHMAVALILLLVVGWWLSEGSHVLVTSDSTREWTTPEGGIESLTLGLARERRSHIPGGNTSTYFSVPRCFAELDVSDVCRSVCLAVGVSCATYSQYMVFSNAVR